MAPVLVKGEPWLDPCCRKSWCDEGGVEVGMDASGADLERGSPTTAAGDSGKSGATFAPGNGMERVLCSTPCAPQRALELIQAQQATSVLPLWEVRTAGAEGRLCSIFLAERLGEVRCHGWPVAHK